MSIFSKIMGGIFGQKKKEETQQKAERASEAPVPVTPTSSAVEESLVVTDSPVDSGLASMPGSMPTAQGQVPVAEVDVAAVLAEKAAGHPEELDWKASIVDLLKLLGIDSSYSARKELAAELEIENYEGSAAQNIEMQKRVMNQVAQAGGIVPPELLS